jgi:hypothetical protein
VPQPTQQTTLQNAASYKKRPSFYIFQWLPVSSKTSSIVAINIHNKCNSKYTMILATRVQVVELWHIKCSSFYARTRRKVARRRIQWMVTGLHWISFRGKGLCKFKVSTKVWVCNEILQWMDWGCSYIKMQRHHIERGVKRWLFLIELWVLVGNLTTFNVSFLEEHLTYILYVLRDSLHLRPNPFGLKSIWYGIWVNKWPLFCKWVDSWAFQCKALWPISRPNLIWAQVL